MTHVFIIPEPHMWDKSFKNRKNYAEEIQGYMHTLVDMIEKYDGEKIIIFPGDIFHRSYAGIDGIVSAFNLFKELNILTNGNVYSCVGNHELSYSANNPFWILAEDNTARFVGLHGIKAFGTMRPGIKIVDELDVGPIQFMFGHYDRKDLVVTSDKDIVYISHNSLIEPEIDEYIRNKFNKPTQTEYMHTVGLRSGEGIPISPALKYVFVGHMHTFYGKFDVEETICNVDMRFTLQYMGSLGRTSVSEIDDNNLDRTIPHFCIEGSTYTYEPINFRLATRADTVLEEVVKENAVKYQNVKTMRQLVETTSFGDTPEQRIDRRLAESPFLLELFHSVYSNELNATITALLKEADAI